MTRTLVIANQKGGIGKSTSVVNIGRALTEKGYRVLLIDLDPQGGLTAAVGVDSFSIRRSVYSLLMYENAPLARLMRLINQNLVLVPASIDLASAEIQLASKGDQALRLRRGLERNRTPFDYIVIDTPPTLGILTANGLVAADELLIPVQCQYLAMRGVRAVIDTYERIQRVLNPNLQLLGVFATMFMDTSPHAREVVAELRSVFGNQLLNTIIPMADVVAEAPVIERSVLDYAPQHPASLAYRQLTQEIIERGASSQ
ncbi:MAG: AAA family ATPase [Chloroflexi bacterium]|nr:AAA family ATPase [Chloroflexota bacterium]